MSELPRVGTNGWVDQRIDAANDLGDFYSESREPIEDCSMESSASNVLTRLHEVFREVFDDDDLTITPSTTAADVEGWDSLQHVTLILGIERAFGVKFTSKQVAKLENVGQMAELIEKLLRDKRA